MANNAASQSPHRFVLCFPRYLSAEKSPPMAGFFVGRSSLRSVFQGVEIDGIEVAVVYLDAFLNVPEIVFRDRPQQGEEGHD